jgi:hypothetical protein
LNDKKQDRIKRVNMDYTANESHNHKLDKRKKDAKASLFKLDNGLSAIKEIHVNRDFGGEEELHEILFQSPLVV